MIIDHRIDAIALAKDHGAPRTAEALADRRKFGFVIFETLFGRGPGADHFTPVMVLRTLAMAQNPTWVSRTIMYGHPWVPKNLLPNFVELLDPYTAYSCCLSVLPDPYQSERHLFMRQLSAHRAERLLRVWDGKWAPNERALLKKIADGG